MEGAPHSDHLGVDDVMLSDPEEPLISHPEPQSMARCRSLTCQRGASLVRMAVGLL